MIQKTLIILIAILMLGVAPKKSMNDPKQRAELRMFADQAKNETLLEYLSSMLWITDQKITNAHSNLDQLKTIQGILEELQKTFVKVDRDMLTALQSRLFIQLESEFDRQSRYVFGTINRIERAERERQTVEKSA